MGLKEAWENSSSAGAEPNWDRAWPDLVCFFEALITPFEFWEQPAPLGRAMVPTRSWIALTIADFLRSGTRNDERTYPVTLLSRTRALVQILLEKAALVDEPSDDAMTQALNSPKGKAIEALISQALMECRAADRATGSHADVWTAVQPLFEAECNKCQDTNFEFSTLAGAYLLSTLATLTPFLRSADGKERELLEAVAPHVHIGYNAHEFVEDQSQFVDVSPDGVNIVIDTVIAARVPDYDHQDRLQWLLGRLAEHGKREDVIRYADRLRHLPGVQELYHRLRDQA